MIMKQFNQKSNVENVKPFIEALSILGARECEVLKYVGMGYTALEISINLSLSVHTVRTHIKAIKKKLNLKGHRTLYQWYQSNSLL